MRTYGLCFGQPQVRPVAAAALATLLEAVQTLLYRLTREAADRTGLGRTVRPVERTSLARVSWAEPGALALEVGDPDTLDIDPLANQVDRAFAQILAGLATGRRPAQVTNPIANAVDALIRVLPSIGPHVRVTLPDGSSAVLATAAISRAPWGQVREESARTVTVAARLEMADLHSGRFRIRDRTGQPYDVTEVSEPDAAARLVGRSVLVKGLLLPGTGTQHHRFEGASIVAAEKEGSARASPEPLALADEQWQRFVAEHRNEF